MQKKYKLYYCNTNIDNSLRSIFKIKHTRIVVSTYNIILDIQNNYSLIKSYYILSKKMITKKWFNTFYNEIINNVNNSL